MKRHLKRIIIGAIILAVFALVYLFNDGFKGKNDAAAKAKLFEKEKSENASINIDDDFGSFLFKTATCKQNTYSLKKKPRFGAFLIILIDEQQSFIIRK